MMNKKGAFELSMTTIVIIVISVVLLSLGLVFVRNVFSKADFLTVNAFEEAEAAIGEIGSVDGPITLSPGSIQIKKGDAKTVELIIANFEEEDLIFKAKISSTSEKVDCVYADTKDTTSKEYTITSGDQATIKIIVDEQGGALGNEVCNIEVDGLPGDNQEELIINVVKA